MTWYAIKTAPQLERRADEALREAGVETFLPMMQSVGRDRNSRRRLYSVPMIPGYVMIRGNIPWRIIGSAQRYGRRLMWGVLGQGAPAPIDDDVIAAIARLDGAPQPAATYKPGDKVRIRIGRLDWREVTVSAVDHGRIQVAMLILGGSRLITLDEGQVEAA